VFGNNILIVRGMCVDGTHNNVIPDLLLFPCMPALWFKEGELCEWTPVQAPWLRE